MIRILALLGLLLFYSQSIVYGVTFTANFDENDFIFYQENGYDVVEHPECDIFGEEGAPQLLVTSYNFIIPVDKTVQSISINSTASSNFSGSYYMFPFQHEDYYKNCCDLPEPDWVDPDPEYYQSQSSYPDVIVEFQKSGFLDGANHIATVLIYPVFFNPSDSTLSYYSSIDFTLNIGGTADKNPIYPQIRMRQDQQISDLILENTVKNPLDIQAYGYTPPQLSDTCIALNDPQDIYFVFPYVIITRDSLVGYWDAYIEWLNRKGMRAGIMSIETIVGYNISDDPLINDHADLLRGYLKYAFEHGTRWVILGGGSEADIHANIHQDEVVVPPRYTIDYNYADQGGYLDCEVWSGNQPQRKGFNAADIYFSELNTDWEQNSNGHPGETDSPPNGDNIDVHLSAQEDLYLGRIPAINGEDITNWIQKILNYEQNPGNGNNDYLFHSLWSLADQPQENDHEGINQPHFPEIFTHHLSEELPSHDDPDPYEPSGDLTVSRMSMWPGFTNWHHHGNINSAAVAQFDNQGSVKWWVRSVSTNCWHGDNACNLECLTNVDKPGFLFSIDCEGSDFPCGYSYTGMEVCVDASYVMLENGGVGSIGTSRYGWVGAGFARKKNKFLEFVFNGDIAEENHRHKVGPAKVWMNSQHPGYSEIKNWTFFGAPDQIIWSDTPKHFTVNPDYENNCVWVSYNGNPVLDASVCFCNQDYSRFCVDTTDENGFAQVPIGYDFDIDFTTNITVTKLTGDVNFIPYQILGSGNIDDCYMWRGDIAFYDDITVPYGDTLFIKPGSNIYLNEDVELSVEGTLIAEGSSICHIVFDKLPSASSEWDWIEFSAKSQSQLEYCDFKNAYIALNIKDTSDVSVSDCSFEDMDVGGIYNSNSKVYVYNSSFESIDNYGINSAYGELVVDKCDFLRCDDYGIQCLFDASANLDSTKITNCNINLYEGGGGGPSGSQYGIYAAFLDISRIQNNVINRYEQGGIKLNNSNTYIKGDTISNSTYYGIYAYNYTDAEMDSCVFNTVATGIYITGYSDPDIKGMWFEASIDTGVYIYGPCQPDLGTAPGNDGNSDFEVCSDYYIYQYNLFSMITIKAENNWFGSSINRRKFYGLIDYNPYLTEDPFLKAAFEGEIPYTYELKSNYPNPFNPTTTFNFSLAEPGYTTLTIYNILGQRVAQPVDGYKQPGNHAVIWNGLNTSGDLVSSGIYFYRIESGTFSETRKMTLLR